MAHFVRFPFLKLGAFTLILFFAVFSAHAQVNQITDTTSTPVQGAGHNYIKMLSETVNSANGSVSLRIQVPTPKGRGISLPFSFSYDSNGTRSLDETGSVWMSNDGYFSQGGWGYSIPTGSVSNWSFPNGSTEFCAYTANFLLQDASGSQHFLGMGQMTDTTIPTNSPACPFSEGQPSSAVTTGGDSQVSTTLANGGAII